MSEFNFVCMNEFWDKATEDALLQPRPDEHIYDLNVNEDMFDILVRAQCFKSKGEARRNWKRTGKEVPQGFSDFTGIGKFRTRITIWIPVADPTP